MAKKLKSQKPKKPEPKKKEKTKSRRKKGQRKKFFPVNVPLTASKIYLYSYNPEDLNGSTIKLDLTKNLRGKNMELRARIHADKEILSAELISLQLLSSYVRKVMRRGIDYVEDSFKTSCKDSVLIIKPFMIARKRVSRSVRKAIRETARKHLEAKTKIRTTEEIFSEIITGKLQKELSLKIKKTYPLALCEIRQIEVTEKKDDKKLTKSEEEKRIFGKTIGLSLKIFGLHDHHQKDKTLKLL